MNYEELLNSCGLARPRSLVGGKSTQVAASQGPRIKPFESRTKSPVDSHPPQDKRQNLVKGEALKFLSKNYRARIESYGEAPLPMNKL